MKVEFHNYLIPQITLNQSSPKEKKQDSGALACKKPFELASRPDLRVHNSLISFGMLKKSKLDEYQLACVNKFKAPIEKFNSKEDFNTWASEKLEEKTDLEQYKNEESLVQNAVKEKLLEWKDYLYSDDVYKENPAVSLIIFDAITKDISFDTHAFPPELHKGVLSNTIGELKDATRNNPTSGFDFNKRYQNNLRLEYTKDVEDVGDGNYEAHWVRIPSKKNDPEHFEKNVKKLKSLSCNTWCTRSTHAEEYLKKGDFYIYIEDNKPKVGIKLNGNKIEEIEGEKNDKRIPLNYLDKIKKFINKEHLEGAEDDIKKAEKALATIMQIKNDFKEDFKEKKYENILKALNIKVNVLKNGMLEIDSFKQPESFSFKELGLDENELFKQVSRIKNNANFRKSETTNLSNLEYIGGYSNFDKSKITNLGKLKYIGQDATFRDSKIKNLENIEFIGGRGDFYHSIVEDLGNLKAINGSANFEKSNITKLNNLKYIGDKANFEKSKVNDLGELETIGGNANFEHSNITSLGMLKTIRGKASFEHSEIIDLGELNYIGKECILENTQVTNLNKLEYVGGDISFYNTKVKELGNLKIIGGKVCFTKSNVESLGKLQYIGGNAYFEESRIIDLKELVFIGGTILMDDIHKLQGNLKHIGGDVYSNNRKVQDKSTLPFYNPTA